MPERSRFKRYITGFCVVIAALLMLQLSQCGMLGIEATDTPENESVRVEQLPMMISSVTPEYPRLAKQAGLEADVWISALVNRAGNVDSVKVKKSSGTQSLDESAMKAAWNNKYKPAIQNGRPMATWVTYKVEFRLAANNR